MCLGKNTIVFGIHKLGRSQCIHHRPSLDWLEACPTNSEASRIEHHWLTTLLTKEYGMVGNIMIQRCGNLGIDRHLSPSFNWRNGGAGGLSNCGAWNQPPNGPLKRNCGNIGITRLISHLAPHASDIPVMAAVMGDGNDHEEFLHLLGDAPSTPLGKGALLWKSSRNMEVFRSRGGKISPVPS